MFQEVEKSSMAGVWVWYKWGGVTQNPFQGRTCPNGQLLQDLPGLQRPTLAGFMPKVMPKELQVLKGLRGLIILVRKTHFGAPHWIA